MSIATCVDCQLWPAMPSKCVTTAKNLWSRHWNSKTKWLNVMVMMTASNLHQLYGTVYSRTNIISPHFIHLFPPIFYINHNHRKINHFTQDVGKCIWGQRCTSHKNHTFSQIVWRCKIRCFKSSKIIKIPTYNNSGRSQGNSKLFTMITSY